MKKILLADDDPDHILILTKLLERHNFEIVSACDGEDAIEKAQDHVPDLIVMDLMMPRVNGGDAAQKLKELEKTKNIPVLFMTSVIKNSDDPDGGGLIAKSVDSKDLLDRIKAIVG